MWRLAWVLVSVCLSVTSCSSVETDEQIELVFSVGASFHQFAKIDNSSLTTTHSARNLGFIFDEHLTFSDQISSVSKSCFTIFASFAVSIHTSIPKQLPPSPLSLFTPSMTTATLNSAQVSDHSAPTDPELSCTCCCQSSQFQSHHSHPPVSTLAKDKWAHWIQAPLTYLQSSHNHPTFISA